MTGVEYQTERMVMDPGGYRFCDYITVSAPFQVLMTIVIPVGIVYFGEG